MESFSSVQFSHSVISDSLQPHEPQHARPPRLSPTLRACSNSCPLSVMPSNHLILCRPFLLLPSIFPNIRVFTNESSNQVVKVSELQLQHHPSNEYSGLISFRIDWFDLLAVQETLKTLLNITGQKHQFFSAQLSLWSNSHIHT